MSGPKVAADPGDVLRPGLRRNRNGRHSLAPVIDFSKRQGPQGFCMFVTLALGSRRGRQEFKAILGLYGGLEQPGLRGSMSLRK